MPRAALPSQTVEAERGALRALKNWLLSTPAENPFADHGVQVRMAGVITQLMERARTDVQSAPPAPRQAD